MTVLRGICTLSGAVTLPYSFSLLSARKINSVNEKHLFFYEHILSLKEMLP